MAFTIIVRYSLTHNTLPSPQASLLFSSSTCAPSPPPVVSQWLAAAAERAGTRTISPAQRDKEDTAEIVTLPGVVTFQPGTAVGRIFARRSVVIDVTPGLTMDFVVGVIHHNADLHAVVARFNNTDIDKVRSRLEPYVPKGKRDKSHTSYYIGEGEAGSLLFASGKPSPSEMQQRAHCKTPLVYQERVLASTHSKSYPVQLLPTLGAISFQDPVEGLTAPAHASGTVVSIPLQGSLPWVGEGDPVVPGQPAAQFVRNTNPSKLDEYGYCFFDQWIPLDMLGKVEAEVDNTPIGEWDPIFQQYPGAHREDDTGDRRILNALRAKKDHIPRYSDVPHHELPSTLALAHFILSVINKSLDDTHELYNAAYVAVTGRERQNLHRDMHKIGPDRRALTVFDAENYDLNANDGTDTIMLPASRGGPPQPWKPVPVELIRGSFFVMYSDLMFH